MKLDYLDQVNAYGENIVRLCDFDKAQAILFRTAIIEFILDNKKELDISLLDFIETRNCNLIFRISIEDEGISTIDKSVFFCDLTIKGYEQMIVLLLPFCTKETSGYQWLYDMDNPTDFLFSPSGSW